MKSVIFSVNLIVLVLSLSFGVNAQGAGSLDTSFGSGGIAATQISANFKDMVIQPDNKIVAVVGSFGIVRFNQNGAIDDTFTQYGTTVGVLCRPKAVLVLPDGKILFGGIYDVQSSVHLCIGRLNSSGTVDTTFDGDGFVQTMMGIESQASSINILPDGKILAAGWTSLITTFNRDYAMVKYNADGSLDTTFGTSGRVATELGSNEFSYASAIQADGKIILVGDCPDTLTNQARAVIVRYNSDGTLDTGFGNNGKVFKLTAANGKADDVEIQPDGKIIIAGYAVVPTRYNSNGTLDTEFNNPAWVTTSSVAIQSNGKILISGSTAPEAISLARYNNNGTLDTTFGVGGITTNTGGMNSNLVFFTKVLLAPDGKIVLGGTRPDGGWQIILARYLNNRPPFMDFDGDSKTDVSIFRPSNGQWWFSRSSDGGNNALQFGISTDKIVPADYTGDGKTDVAIFRPSNGQWFILRSEDLSFYAFPFGISEDIPVPADFDGDGKADAAVFRPSTNTWFINKSSGGTDIIGFGASGDKPVVADFDGDGKTDIAIFRPNGTNGAEWWIRRSSNGSVFALQFGTSTDKAVPGDFTGDGKADVAFWRPSNGNWFILRSEDFSFYSFPFGASGDTPVAGDYDGDGKFDAGVFRPTNSTWFIQRSTAGTLIQTFGIAGDLPTPDAFVP